MKFYLILATELTVQWTSGSDIVCLDKKDFLRADAVIQDCSFTDRGKHYLATEFLMEYTI
jgi:hypothetical protein